MRRLFWVAVGAAAGVYAVRKVQQTLHAYSPAGLTDRAGSLGESVKAFADEVRAGMADREAALREALGMPPADGSPPLTPAEAAALIDHPAADHPRDHGAADHGAADHGAADHGMADRPGRDPSRRPR